MPPIVGFFRPPSAWPPRRFYFPGFGFLRGSEEGEGREVQDLLRHEAGNPREAQFASFFLVSFCFVFFKYLSSVETVCNKRQV